MRHLTEEQLALGAGNDLQGFDRWRADRHLRRCPTCRMAYSELVAARASVKEAATELPDGVNWDALERDMRANIRVGLAAAACVTPERTPERLDVRAAVAFAALTIVVLTGWYLSMPRFVPRPFASVTDRGAVVEATPAGVELKHGPQGLVLLNPQVTRVTYSVDTQGAQARYVDQESGQVTVTQVTITNVALD